MSFRDQVNGTVNWTLAKFQEHPKSNGHSYMNHLMQSMYFSLCSFVCTVVFCLHALFPFLFQTTGGNVVKYLEQLIADVRLKAAENKACLDQADTTTTVQSDTTVDQASNAEEPSLEQNEETTGYTTEDLENDVNASDDGDGPDGEGTVDETTTTNPIETYLVPLETTNENAEATEDPEEPPTVNLNNNETTTDIVVDDTF